MVAMRGSIIPEPLVMPPTRTRPSGRVISTAADFGKGSVVMIASAAAAPPSVDSASIAAGMPARRAGIFRFTPMTPVEATSTSRGSQPMPCAASTVISRASARPCGPVQALAQPLLVTTARARPPDAARCSCETSTGAAWAMFVVNTAAAAAGVSLTSSARSFLPLALMPQCSPAARNPAGAVTPPGIAVIDVVMPRLVFAEAVPPGRCR